MKVSKVRGRGRARQTWALGSLSKWMMAQVTEEKREDVTMQKGLGAEFVEGHSHIRSARTLYLDSGNRGVSR